MFSIGERKKEVSSEDGCRKREREREREKQRKEEEIRRRGTEAFLYWATMGGPFVSSFFFPCSGAETEVALLVGHHHLVELAFY